MAVVHPVLRIIFSATGFSNHILEGGDLGVDISNTPLPPSPFPFLSLFQFSLLFLHVECPILLSGDKMDIVSEIVQGIEISYAKITVRLNDFDEP